MRGEATRLAKVTRARTGRPAVGASSRSWHAGQRDEPASAPARWSGQPATGSITAGRRRQPAVWRNAWLDRSGWPV